MSEPYSRALFHYETDADGVCHFSNYFRIGEEAFYHAIGQSFLDMNFAVIESSAQYKNPLRFGSVFSVSIQKIEMRRSNFELFLLIEEKELEIANLKLRFVAMDPKKWEIIPLPQELKQRLKEYDTRSNHAFI